MGKVCCFFGHRDTPDSVKEKLKRVIIDLIENKGVDTFYMGNQGSFDSMARATVSELQKQYSNINYRVMLAYMPKNGDIEIPNSVYSEGLENVPPRFAIDRRNKIMLEKSDYVIVYVISSVGGAAKFYRMAEKKRKVTINIYDLNGDK